jgi:hypothetical protein
MRRLTQEGLRISFFVFCLLSFRLLSFVFRLSSVVLRLSYESNLKDEDDGCCLAINVNYRYIS